MEEEEDDVRKALKWIPTLRERKDITYMYEFTTLDEILDRDNLNDAYKQVVKKKGAAGVDGMTINDLGGYLAKNRDKIVQGIRERKYEPQPVLRVEIPKPDGGTRLLGVPTVVDR